MELPDFRVTLAASVAVSLTCELDGAQVDLAQTTSGCPIVVVQHHGRTYHLTITNARKQADHE